MSRQLVLLPLVVFVGACSCPERERERGVKVDKRRVRLIHVPSAALGAQPVVVLLPRGYDPRRRVRYPLLIAFSGRGEAVLPPERGAWGWVRDYRLLKQMQALERGRLRAADLGGMVTAAQLERYNRSLASKPFASMVVACPHTFDLLGTERPWHDGYARFYLEELPADLRRRLHVRTDARGLGVDGVSLGGLWSLVLGFSRPERVGQIGALQPAVTPFLERLVELARARRKALASRPLSLVTSTGDGLRPAVTKLSARLRGIGVRHKLTVLQGPHDYAFNRGPGGIYMLLWHDRIFQGVQEMR
jgi:enterochelin esterase-like enzyme